MTTLRTCSSHTLHRARREAARDQPAQLVVARRVHVDHRLARLDLLLVEVLERGAADLGREGSHVAVDEADVLVAGDRPEAAGRRARRSSARGPRGAARRTPRAGRASTNASWSERSMASSVVRGVGHGLRGGGGTRRAPSPDTQARWRSISKRLIARNGCDDLRAERVAQDVVGLERVERGLERRGQRVAAVRLGAVGVALDGRRAASSSLAQAVRAGGAGRRDRQVRVGAAVADADLQPRGRPRSGGMRTNALRLSQPQFACVGASESGTIRR